MEIKNAIGEIKYSVGGLKKMDEISQSIEQKDRKRKYKRKVKDIGE